MRARNFIWATLLALPLHTQAEIISHRENVPIQILQAENRLTCFTNDFNHEIGEVSLDASAVQNPVVLNGHGYLIQYDHNATEACDKVKEILDEAVQGHPGTGIWLSALASSDLELDGSKLSETVTVKVFPAKDPDHSFTFSSTSVQTLAPVQN